MKPYSNIHEILLSTTSSFSHRQLCERIDPEKSNLTSEEELEAACWNGLLNELLPEIMPSGAERLFLWNIEARSCFLTINMAAYPSVTDTFYSIDPYIFLGNKQMN